MIYSLINSFPASVNNKMGKKHKTKKRQEKRKKKVLQFYKLCLVSYDSGFLSALNGQEGTVKGWGPTEG